MIAWVDDGVIHAKGEATMIGFTPVVHWRRMRLRFTWAAAFITQIILGNVCMASVAMAADHVMQTEEAVHAHCADCADADGQDVSMANDIDGAACAGHCFAMTAADEQKDVVVASSEGAIVPSSDAPSWIDAIDPVAGTDHAQRPLGGQRVAVNLRL